MNKFEGTTTISSHEYRQLIEDLAFFKNLYDRAERENTELNETVAKLRQENANLSKDLAAEKDWASYLRQKANGLEEELRPYKEIEAGVRGADDE